MPSLFSSISAILLAAAQRVLAWPNRPQQPHRAAPEPQDKKRILCRKPIYPVVQELHRIIEQDANLYMGFHQMFEEIPDDPKYRLDPTGKPQVRNYQDMLDMFDELLTRAPEYGEEVTGELAPVPLNAMLNWPMCTSAGLRVFTNEKVNAQLKKLLATWAHFLSSPRSRYLLTDDRDGWFGPAARKSMPDFEKKFECDSAKEYWGFDSWDDFFTRRFRPGVRPVCHPQDNTIITKPCESTAYKINHNVQALSPFWLKGEPYSLSHMLNNDPLTSQFVGGTIYQAYLSALNYHRWHSPVDGTIVKIIRVPSTYFAASPSTGFESGDPDPAAPVRSQAFTMNLATRVLIFIQADSPSIGLLCFIAVGMVEVSSCDATVSAAQRVRKGDELGMYHYGGSTYCLVFRPETKIAFSDAVCSLSKMERREYFLMTLLRIFALNRVRYICKMLITSIF